MYVEIIDGRFAGQMRDMEPGVALDLIRLGRAKHANFDAPAPEAPVIVARVDEPTDKPYVAWDRDHEEPTVIVVPEAKAKKRK